MHSDRKSEAGVSDATNAGESSQIFYATAMPIDDDVYIVLPDEFGIVEDTPVQLSLHDGKIVMTIKDQDTDA